MTDWKALCEELADALACHYPGHVDDDELLNRARAALAETVGEGPSRLRTERRTGPFGEWTALIPCNSPAPAPAGGVAHAAHVRRMCDIILNNTFGNEELDSLALFVGHHPDVLNASPAADGEVE